LGDYNQDLLRLIPDNAVKIIEIGCSHGALAKAYKQINQNCNYIGVEINPTAAKTALNSCDKVYECNIETVDDDFLANNLNGDCWIFGDVLEHLSDPWRMLTRIRKIMTKSGSVIACIPNAQHWSVQAKLSIGDFRYDPKGGLLDRTHLRWFTRATIFELFSESGFQIVAGHPRIFDNSSGEKFLEAIRLMATYAGADPNVAVNDSLPLQYVVKAMPI
jgi:2-polyprenyl-3-methyl-5-hydroxy-6-metoxy-1,4-benzoquinol methylase